MIQSWLQPEGQHAKLTAFILRNWRQSDWLSSLTWIGIGLLVFVHLFCFAAIVLSRVYYGESFNPAVFAQFIEARKDAVWNPLAPAPTGVVAAAPGGLPAPGPVKPTPTILSDEPEAVAAELAGAPAASDWVSLTEEERQLVRERKIQLAQNSMREAERKWLLGQRKDALDSLHQVLNELPDYTPLVMQMAEFYQESGDYSKASFFWEKVKILADKASPETAVAAERLAQIDQLQRAAEAAGSGRRAIGAGRLRVVRAEEKRAPLEDLYDLKFNLEITLSSNLSEATVDPQQTRIEILFFDQYETSGGAVLPVRTLSTSVRPNRAWPSLENETLSVTYSVPRGYWRKKLKTYGKSYDFCGYVVRVYYRGEFQDASWSKDLLIPWRTPVS